MSLFASSAGACGDGKDGGSDTGVVVLEATAFNAGAGAQSPRLVDATPLLPPALVAMHTIDPATYRVHQWVSGPATEVKLTIKRIIVEGDNGAGSALLFGTDDGSGPGAEITLTNGTIDLSGLELDPVPTGHYTRLNIWPSRAVKMKGCVTGTFSAETATPWPNGMPYTSESITAGSHTFCTLTAKSPVDFQNGTAVTGGPIGTNAEFEAQTTPEELEFDMGAGNQIGMTGTYPSNAADVRAAVGNMDVYVPFDVDSEHAVQLTLVFDMNRVLQFWPNVRPGSAPRAFPPGTSTFFSDNFNQTIAAFVGTAGSIEGYQLNSEVCQDVGCMPGDPPDGLSREWMTVVRDPSGAISAGFIAPDDAPPAIFGDLVPPLTTAGTVPGTLHLSVGLYRGTAEEHGYVDGFAFKTVGDAEDSCSAYPVMGNGPVDGHGPFPLWYARKL